MSRKDSESAAVSAKAPTTVDEAVGPLTQNAVDGADDAVTKKLLQDARTIVIGLATLLLASDDPQDEAVVKLLAEVNVGMRDVQMLAALGGAVLAAASARDAAETAAREATSKLDAARTKLHDGITSFGNLARGKLGAKSPALDKFGIKSMGGRKGMKRAPKKPAADKKDSDSTPKP